MRRATTIIFGCLVAVALVAAVLWSQWRDPQRRFEHALAALESGDLSSVEADIRLLGDDDRYALHQQYLQGALLLKKGQPLAALAHFSPCRDHPDLEVESLILSGQAHYQLGGAGNAKLLWEEALAIDPGAIDAHRWLGVMYYDVGSMDHAILHLKEVSRLDPSDPRPDRLMGLINKDYERPHLAIDHYRESLRRAPQQAGVEQVRLELAACQVKQKEFEAALETITQSPPSALRHVIEAECRLNLGQPDQALQKLELALALAPHDLDALLLQGQLLLEAGDPQQAVVVFERATEHHPSDYNARFQFVQALRRIGEEDRADRNAQIAHELRDTWAKFSDLHVDAINQPTNADLRFQMGELALKLGRAELARTWFQAALAIDPTHAEAARQLQRAAE